MQIILSRQSGKSDYVTVDPQKPLHSSIADYLKISTSNFDAKYSLVFSEKIVNESFPKDLEDGDTIVLLHHQRQYINEEEEENKKESDVLDIQELIDQKMKKYALPDIVIEPDAEKLATLTEMGFPSPRAKKALILSYENPEEALNWLLSHTDDPTADEPLTQKELREITQKQKAFIPDESKLKNLIEMGFSKELSLQALRYSNNSFERAFSWLTGEAPSAGPSVIIQDPRIAEVLQIVSEDPSRITDYLNDPEISPILLQIIRQARGVPN